MLIDSTTAPTVHHYLLFFIDGKTTFSPWQVIFSRYGVEIDTWYLDEDIISRYVKL